RPVRFRIALIEEAASNHWNTHRLEVIAPDGGPCHHGPLLAGFRRLSLDSAQSKFAFVTREEHRADGARSRYTRQFANACSRLAIKRGTPITWQIVSEPQCRAK